MTNRKQCAVGALVGVTIGLVAFVLAQGPIGIGELLIASAAAAIAVAWWRQGHRS